MSVHVTLQLDADTRAGDWATRPAGTARSRTTSRGLVRSDGSVDQHTLAIRLGVLRNAVEAARRGCTSETLDATRTRPEPMRRGDAPVAYRGLFFVIGA